MRQRVSEKLHSKRGASLLLALLYLLVCLTVGAVVLTAAATNAGRIERNRRQQQDYLAVASAVELVKEDLKHSSFTGSYREIAHHYIVKVDSGNVDAQGNSIMNDEWQVLITYEKGGTETTGSLLSKCSDKLTDLYYSTTPLGEAGPTDMSYALKFEAEHEFPSVIGSMSISTAAADRYSMTVPLKTEEGTNGTTLHLSPTIQQKSPPDTSEAGDKGSNYTITTTYTTTVTWNAPVVSKGAAK